MKDLLHAFFCGKYRRHLKELHRNYITAVQIQTVFIHGIAHLWANQETQDDIKSLQLKLLSNPCKSSG